MMYQPIAQSSARWCILRMAAPRTLLVVASLAAAGFQVWTPTQVKTRAGRGKNRHKVEQYDAAMMPTFAFAAADRAWELAALSRSPVNPHPAFSVLRHRDMIPAVSDSSLQPLRDQEIVHLKTTRHVIAAGSTVSVKEGAFAGMSGIVESGDGKVARVNFGGGFSVAIATYLFKAGVVEIAPEPRKGAAAKAALTC